MHEELKRLEDAVINCFMVPKEWLPESYQGKRSHRSLKSVVKEAQKRGVIETEHAKLKRLKAEKIALYRECVENGVEIDWQTDDNKLYRNQMCFAQLMELDLDEE